MIIAQTLAEVARAENKSAQNVWAQRKKYTKVMLPSKKWQSGYIEAFLPRWYHIQKKDDSGLTRVNNVILLEGGNDIVVKNHKWKSHMASLPPDHEVFRWF